MKGDAHMIDDEDSFDDPYPHRQREQDEVYRREYKQWIDSLSPEERRQVRELGLDKAYLPSGSGGATKDAAESSRARCEAVEPADAPPADEALPSEQLHELLRRLVGEMVSQANARLSLECLALVTGLAYEGDSMTEIAKRHDVTRAAVSKRCVELTQALNLNPSRAMRSLLARKSYSKARYDRLRRIP